MTQLDKKRLGFTPEEGQNQWTRSCQNSGNDKKRRPAQTVIQNISELIKKGYYLNKKTGEYEKRVLFKKKGKKDIEDFKKFCIKVNRKLNREESLENSTGWNQVNKIFKSKKDYNRNHKHKKGYE